MTDAAEAEFERALGLHQAGDPARALAGYDRALTLNPNHAVAWLNRGAALRSLGRLEDAVASYNRAVAIRPDYAQAYSNRGNVLLDLQRMDDAVESFDRAIALKPDLAEAWSNRANALNSLRQFEEAVDSAGRALALNPVFATAHYYRGNAFYGLGQTADALSSYDAAIAMAPGHADAHWNKALCLLLTGDFARGWELYEWRLRGEQGRRKRLQFPQIPGLGRAAVQDKSVLLQNEQGIGDQIMFASMIPDLAADAASVTSVCDPRMLPLLRNSIPNVDFVASSGAHRLDAAEFDTVFALGSLGRLYRGEANTFPRTPYLKPRDGAVAAWSERLGAKTTRLRVGLSWRGGTPATDTEARSLNLMDLRPLLDLADVEFVSLQYGEAGAEVRTINANLTRPVRIFPAADIDDFEQLAALVLNLDLVVSVQTALIHLSGAIGAPCLVLTPFAPQWRYGASGPAMPWYGSVRLLRQPRAGDWTSVIGEAAQALSEGASA